MVLPKNIFLADDDCDDVDFFTAALSEICDDYNLFVANDGHELLSKIQAATTRPDIIFLDVNMPRMNGIDALATIRSTAAFGKEVPVIIYSTSSNDVFVRKAYDAGANYFFTKPVDFQKLKDRINDFLRTDWKNTVELTYDKFAELV